MRPYVYRDISYIHLSYLRTSRQLWIIDYWNSSINFLEFYFLKVYPKILVFDTTNVNSWLQVYDNHTSAYYDKQGNPNRNYRKCEFLLMVLCPVVVPCWCFYLFYSRKLNLFTISSLLCNYILSYYSCHYKIRVAPKFFILRMFCTLLLCIIKKIKVIVSHPTPLVWWNSQLSHLVKFTVYLYDVNKIKPL